MPNSIHITVDLRVYRLSAVQKAAYRLAERCTIALGAPSDDTLPLTIMLRHGASDEDALAIQRLLFQELLDQELREAIAEDTRPLRALILAHAFSKTGLIRRDG